MRTRTAFASVLLAALAGGCFDDPSLGGVGGASSAPAFVAPQSGDVLAGRVRVVVTPARRDATAVRIMVGQTELGVATAAPWTFEVDTTALADGVTVLEAIEEHGGGPYTSSTLAVWVDNAAPSIEIVWPADGAVVFVEDATARFTARVRDDTGVARVDLRAAGASVASFEPPGREELGADLDLAALAPAAIAGETTPLRLEVEVSDENGHVAIRTVDVAVGTRLEWRFDTLGAIETPPLALPGGAVAVGSFDGNLYVVEADGTERCRVETGEEVVGAPALLADGSAIVWGTTRRLRAADAATCAVRWTYSVGGQPVEGVFRGGPTVAPDGTVLAVEFTGVLHAIDSAGRGLWQAQLVGQGIAAPAVGPTGLIVVGTLDGQLHAFGPDGTARWTYAAGGGIGAPALVTDDAVYFGSYDFYVYALDLEGEPLWAFPFATDMDIQCTPGLLPTGDLVTCSRDRNVYAIDAATGEESWRFATAGITYGGVAIGPDSTIYVGVADGSVQAIGPTGRLRWRFDTQQPVVARPSPSDAFVFVGSTDRSLYCLSADRGDGL